jgi:DNA-binding transcriptional MerR regulator
MHMRGEALKVGDLARRTGLTVRTLHHYDAIGLLRPSGHTDSGYRLYTPVDVARLQQVLSLRQLGFSLEQIRECLDGSNFSPLEIIELHLSRLREHIDLQRKLYERLETLVVHLRSTQTVCVDEFLSAIQETTMLEALQEKYFTPEQLQVFKDKRAQVGQEHLERMQETWAEVIALIRAEMDKGTDPADPKVQALARRWQDLVAQSTGGDPQVEQSLKRLWEEQGDNLAAQFGAQYDSRPIWGYITQAIQAARG